MIYDKLVMYLMNEKGYYTLQKITEEFGSGIVEYVVTGTDRHVKDDFSNEIISLCVDKDIQHYDRNDELPEFGGYIFAVGWRWIIKCNIERLIVFHDSLLPKYRGFAPLVNMLINGERQIGVTALYAAEKYDAGDIIVQKSISIDYPIKIERAIEKIKVLYFENAEEIIKSLLAGKSPRGIPQDENKVTFSAWRDAEDYEINWRESDSDRIARSVDALGFPYEGAYTFLDTKKIYIDDVISHPDIHVESPSENAGKLIFMEGDRPFIICRSGVIEIVNGHYEDGTAIIPVRKFRSRFGR